MSDARDRILQMLAEGKLKMSEAAEVLDALDTPRKRAEGTTLEIEVETG